MTKSMDGLSAVTVSLEWARAREETAHRRDAVVRGGQGREVQRRHGAVQGLERLIQGRSRGAGDAVGADARDGDGSRARPGVRARNAAGTKEQTWQQRSTRTRGKLRVLLQANGASHQRAEGVLARTIVPVGALPFPPALGRSASYQLAPKPCRHVFYALATSYWREGTILDGRKRRT